MVENLGFGYWWMVEIGVMLFVLVCIPCFECIAKACVGDCGIIVELLYESVGVVDAVVGNDSDCR